MSDTLEVGEQHPMAQLAYRYVKDNLTARDTEAMASCAIEGNRMAEVCLGTANRINRGEPVSDRYILGLAWFVKQMRDCEFAKKDGWVRDNLTKGKT